MQEIKIVLIFVGILYIAWLLLTMKECRDSLNVPDFVYAYLCDIDPDALKREYRLKFWLSAILLVLCVVALLYILVRG